MRHGPTFQICSPRRTAGCVVAGFVDGQPGGAYIAELDSSGKLLWQREFLAPVPSCTFKTLRGCADGTWVAAGTARTSYDGPAGLFAMGLASDGSPLWSRIYQGSTQEWSADIQPLDGDGFLLATREMDVLRLLPDGSLASCRTLGNAYQTLQSLEKSPDGRLRSMAGRFFHRPAGPRWPSS